MRCTFSEIGSGQVLPPEVVLLWHRGDIYRPLIRQCDSTRTVEGHAGVRHAKFLNLNERKDGGGGGRCGGKSRPTNVVGLQYPLCSFGMVFVSRGNDVVSRIRLPRSPGNGEPCFSGSILGASFGPHRQRFPENNPNCPIQAIESAPMELVKFDRRSKFNSGFQKPSGKHFFPRTPLRSPVPIRSIRYVILNFHSLT